MGIPFCPPLHTADAWTDFALEVRRCRGAACFGATAAHFGTTSPKTLEERVDGKRYVTRFQEPTSSGKYRAWFRDGARPSDHTAKHIRARSGDAVDLTSWRDLPLWDLLSPTPPPMDRLHRYPEAMPPAIGRLLFGDSPGWRHPRFLHHHLERTDYLAIRNIGTLDAFICLLCLACKGDLLDHDPSHLMPAQCAFDVLPHVLNRYPALEFRWDRLFKCLSQVFWQRLYGSGAIYEFDIRKVHANLTALKERRPEDVVRISGIRRRREQQPEMVTGRVVSSVGV